jgi:hypothetical protein
MRPDILETALLASYAGLGLSIPLSICGCFEMLAHAGAISHSCGQLPRCFYSHTFSFTTFTDEIDERA